MNENAMYNNWTLNYEIEINQPIITKLKTPGTTTTQGMNKIELQL